jgi:hypothetical protein
MSAELILDSVAQDADFESDMLDSGQSMIDCRSSLRFIGPPPVNPQLGVPEPEDSDRYEAWKEACVSYAAAGKLFYRGIELRNVVILKAAYPLVRDGDRALCKAGVSGFTSCRKLKKQSGKASATRSWRRRSHNFSSPTSRLAACSPGGGSSCSPARSPCGSDRAV